MNEIAVFTMLDSLLHRALVHVVGVTGPALEADISAIRLFDTGSVTHTTHVDARRLGLPDATLRALYDWPLYPNSAFEHLRRRAETEGVFRLDPSNGNGHRLFNPIDKHVQVADALCASFRVNCRPYCLGIFVRCGRNLPFTDSHLHLLKRLVPQMRRAVEVGYSQELGLDFSLDREDRSSAFSPKVAQLLTKLTRTEFEIFQHLRTNATEKRIARTFSRSPHTVHVHVKNIYRKLGVHSRKMLNDLTRASSETSRPDGQ